MKKLSWIKKRTDSIWSSCEGFLVRVTDGDIATPVDDLIYEVLMDDSIRYVKGELLRDKEKKPELIAENITDNLKGAFIMTFGLGFVIGGMVELIDSKGLKAVEELREELRRFKIFPYHEKAKEESLQN